MERLWYERGGTYILGGIKDGVYGSEFLTNWVFWDVGKEGVMVGRKN